jgi:hypothetical protein
MDKKRELLAKALMDASKVLLITIYIKNFLDPTSFSNLQDILGHGFAIISTGYSAWLLQPKAEKKRKNK